MSEEQQHKDVNEQNGQLAVMGQAGDRGQGEHVFDGMLTTQSSSFRSFEFKDETKATHWRAKGYVVPRNVNAETLGSPPAKRATKRKTAPTKIVHADGQNWMKYGQKVIYWLGLFEMPLIDPLFLRLLRDLMIWEDASKGTITDVRTTAAQRKSG